VSERACFIVNPRSAAGATGRRLSELQALGAARFTEVSVRETLRPMHGAELAREALREGFDLIVAVGGDGTVNEVVNGFFEEGSAEPLRPGAALAVLPAGTGGDLVKTLGVPRDWAQAVAFAADTPSQMTDVVVVDLVNADGQPVRRLGINVTGIGMSGEVVRRANQGTKRLGGTVTFGLATLGAMASWKAPEVRLTWEAEAGPGSWTGPLSNLFLANGRYCGGGMHVGKGGEMDDGRVELTLIPELPLHKMLRATPRLYSGDLFDVDGVTRLSVTRLEAEVVKGGGVLVDVDGEQPGVLPLRLSVLPRAIPVRRVGTPVR
jgi:YegS/Rv2252/BmrU family lipid kinase